jgi:FMN phosphatase YigB (HAD superfamily)
MNHPEVVTEWIQTILRREKQDSAYEILMAIAKWKHMSLQSLLDFIEYLWQEVWGKKESLFLEDLDDELKNTVKEITLQKSIIDELKDISPLSFIGEAPKIAEKWNERLISFMKKFDKQIALTTRDRVQAILFDFDNTLQLWDKEELESRLTNILNQFAMAHNLPLWITEEEMQEVYKLSCFREMKTKMVEFAASHWVEITETQIQDANNKVTWNFDEEFYLDEWSEDLLRLLNKNNIPVWIISTRWTQSLLRVINDIHMVWNNVDIILSRDDVEERKPSPEWIKKALEKLNISPDQVYYVWDKFREDVKAAQNAWVTPIYIERSNEWLSIEEKWEVLTFSNIKELYNYLYSKLI